MALALLCLAGPASAAPWMWDQDTDGIDDRFEAVFLNGVLHAYEELDPDGRLRFELSLVDNALQYGAYVLYDHTPTAADSASLVLLGAQVISRFQGVPYIRVRAIYPTLLTITARPEVIRVEAVSLMYPVNWREGRAIGVRSGGGTPFPTLEGDSDPTGEGVVVAILDTGINDTPQGSYPGHVDLAGKVVGGAWYGGAGPAGYSPWEASTNPSQTAVGGLSFHGTHIAGTIAGGSRDRTLGGLVPEARLLDVKVLGDDGWGHGLAEGLEWCLRNKDRNWGGGYDGIDVVNLSLSGTDPSDGTDCVCALVNATVANGIVVVASAGNDGQCGALPAPGAADLAITVGASDLGATPDPGDNTLAPFSNEGPRASDGDGSLADEMKPDLVAPGVGVLSASGSPIESGYRYTSADGTSMSAALVSGVAALLRGEATAISPADVKEILRRTAGHRSDATRPCSQGQDPFGLDPQYHAGWGFGELDAWAAWMELTHSSGTQFVRLVASWNDLAGAADVTWTTQREKHLTGFHVERAPDVGGAPGTFVTVTGPPVPAVGPQMLNIVNRTTYTISDPAPAGGLFWYRIVTTGGVPSDTSAPFSVRTETPAGVARFTISHNTPETDLALSLGSGFTAGTPDWSRAVVRENLLSAALVTPVVPGSDRIVYSFSRPLYAGEGAALHLPPSTSSPWFLNGVEGGDAGRSGTLDSFEIESGAVTYVTDTTLPKSTVEGGSAALWIPEAAVSGAPNGDGRVSRPSLAAWPNPFRGAARVELSIDRPEPVRLVVLDVQGREVRVVTQGVKGAGVHAFQWDGRDGRGRSLPSGRYYLLLERTTSREVLPVVRLD